MSDKVIIIGSPIQNKIWSINVYLDSLLNQDYPKDKIHFIFYLNDSTDGTAKILVDRMKKVKESGEYAGVHVVKQNWGFVDELRVDREDVKTIARQGTKETAIKHFAHFARVRNAWLQQRKEFNIKADYYFSVDSDIVMEQPFALRQLVSQDKDFIALPVDNSQNRNDNYHTGKDVLDKLLKSAETPEEADRYLAIFRGKVPGVSLGPDAYFNFGVIRNGRYRQFDPTPGLFEVDITGACCLFKTSMIENGVEYGAHPGGEDYYFCQQAKLLGYKLYVDGTLRTIHCMDFVPEKLLEKVVS